MEIWQLSLMVFSILLVIGFLIRYWDSLRKIARPKIVKKIAESLKEHRENRGNGLEQVKSMRERYEEYKDEE